MNEFVYFAYDKHEQLEKPSGFMFLLYSTNNEIALTFWTNKRR